MTDHIPEYRPPENTEPLEPITNPPAAAQKSRGLLLPIVLMVWPLIIIVITIVLYAIINFIFSSSETTSGDELFTTNPMRSFFNTILFLFGATVVAIGPISFIIGVVLLIMRLQKK